MMIPGVRRPGMLALLLVTAACSSSPSPQTAPTPATEGAAASSPVVESARLMAPGSAIRASETVELTGTEMGTMWTFENPPLDYWEATYGFRPTSDWLDHVRLASVRYGRGCSASFISPNGLVITNNHCARGCIDAVSTVENDYLNDGFYAPTREDELVCPGLYLDQLIAIDDITDEIRSAGEAELGETEITEARIDRGRELDAACEEETDLQCQVVSLFHGGQYKLYKYRRFSTVKLVFTPETQAAFFGGDPDNFTYPRYDLDVSFVRAYEEGGTTPAATPEYFRWDADGAQEGELVFVTGNPGSTARQITVSQYLYEKEVRHPVRLDLFDQRLEVLHAVQRSDPERGRALQNTIFGLENAQKLYRGELKGLRDTLLTAKKIRWEREFRARVETDSSLAAEYGDVWQSLAAIQAEKAALYPALLLTDATYLIPSAHLALAGRLSRYVRMMARPEEERTEDYRGARLERLEASLSDPGEMALDQSESLLAGQIALAQKWLPADAALVQVVGDGESLTEAARRLVEGSQVSDAGFCQSVLKMKPEQLEQSTDALIRLVLAMEAEQTSVAERWRSVRAAEDFQNERFASALFAVYGTDLPPDATFTLRITDGVLKRYHYNGTYAPAQTTLYGLYARSAEFGNEMPWTLAPTLEERRDDVDMSVPINFVSTNDITGGNSGSPVIDREARWVGIAFDGNVEAFPNEFLFAAENGRTVAVHAAGITEALRSAYRTDELLEEILSASE